MSIDDRIKGSIMGLAIGDALGAPVECLSRKAIMERYGKVTDHVEMPREFNPKTRLSEGDYRIKGVYTDDTQLALALVESLTENKGFYPERYAQKLVELYRYIRGPGRSVRLAIHSLKEGETWDKSGKMEGVGNGAAIRIAPLGVYYRGNYSELKDKAIKSAMITHTNPEVIAAAVSIAFSAAYAVNHEHFDSKDYLNEVSKFVGDIGPDFSAHLKELTGLLEIPTPDALEMIGTKSLFTQSIPSAVYLFSKHHDDISNAIIHAINAGGDTDSVGAMTGALVGGYKGYSSMPEMWLSGLRNRRDIEERAEALASTNTQFRRTLNEMEKELTLEERAARKDIREDYKRSIMVKNREDKIREVEKATDELVSQIPQDERDIHFDIKSFSEGMIKDYLAGDMPERCFSGFLSKVKRTKPEYLKELEGMRLEYLNSR